jgi:hypothetical protein
MHLLATLVGVWLFCHLISELFEIAYWKIADIRAASAAKKRKESVDTKDVQ